MDSSSTTARTRRLSEYVERFRGRRVVVLGDLVADEFVYGDINRVSREAPVLILEHQQTVTAPGGGANSVANLRALGARPTPIGVVGPDASGERLIAALRGMGCSASGIVRLAGYATPTKSRILAGGIHTRRQQIVRLDRGASHGELPARARAQLLELGRRAIRNTEGLLVADYGYGAATPQLAGRLLKSRALRGLPVTVDSRSRVHEFHGITATTPNQEEVEQAVGLAADADDRQIAEGARKLRRKIAAKAVVVTRGARGMELYEQRGRAVKLPAYGAGDVADVTGAGDTVIAVFTLGLIVGASVVDAATLANYAAGIVVTRMGTATVDRDDLLAAVHEDRG